MSKPFDATMKDVLVLAPEAWPRLLGYPATAARIVNADIATISGPADHVIPVKGKPDWIHHVDFQAGPDAGKPRELNVYNSVPEDRHECLVRNGPNASGSPTFRCLDRGRRFVARPRKGPVSDEQPALVRRLLAERVSLRGIARATGLSRSWVQQFVNRLFREQTPPEPGELKRVPGPLIVEADERWSFVGSKSDPWWVRVALDADTRQGFWEALPEADRNGAIVRTDFLATDWAVVPAERHAPGQKGDGLTNHVERFFGTLRQRRSRFVRKTFSFSECLWNHLGALWYFIRD